MRQATKRVTLLVVFLGSVEGASGCGNANAQTTPPGYCERPGVVVWFDADGKCVERFVTQVGVGNQTHSYVDESGLWWRVDTIDEFIGPILSGEHSVYYESSDCSGEALLRADNPRLTFLVQGDDQIRVRPDSLQATVKMLGSVDSGSGCQDITFPPLSLPVYAASSTLPNPPLTPPPFPYRFPLHAELIAVTP